jgi:NAD+ synthase
MRRIVSFIQSTVKKSGLRNVILGVSGGIDSATSLYLLKESIPLSQIYVIHLPYFDGTVPFFNATIAPLNLPQDHILLSPINMMVDPILSEQHILNPQTETEKIRRGNIMSRVRMIVLYDFARKLNALVCGTENKSERYLGYFTRFGDAASDFEPIQHVYKTQVKLLAEYLNVPEKIRTSPPSAGLWSDQTDENELGFTYEEADQVLDLHFGKKVPIAQIDSQMYPHGKQILEHARKMEFKHEVPYTLP